MLIKKSELQILVKLTPDTIEFSNGHWSLFGPVIRKHFSRDFAEALRLGGFPLFPSWRKSAYHKGDTEEHVFSTMETVLSELGNKIERLRMLNVVRYCENTRSLNDGGVIELDIYTDRLFRLVENKIVEQQNDGIISKRPTVAILSRYFRQLRKADLQFFVIDDEEACIKPVLLAKSFELCGAIMPVDIHGMRFR